MPDQLTMDVFTERFIVGLLLFARCTAMMMTAPFFNNTAISPQIKVILSAFIALLMTVAFGAEQPDFDFEVINLIVLVFKEVLVGLIIGFASNLVFQAVRFAGALADFDMGYNTSTLFNLNFDAPTLIGEVKSLIVLMIFLIMNGHHFLIEAVYASAKAIPITTFVLSGETTQLIIGLISLMFLIGIKIAAPILISLFIANLALALLARTAPQINIFILSFQFKIMVGLIVLMVTVPVLVYVIKNALEIFEGEIMKLILSIQAAALA